MLFNFWIRRWFRTLPNYFLILLVLLWLTHLEYPSYTFAKVKEYFYFSQNLWYNHPPFFPEAWSLSIEEWFYLIVPLLLFLLVKFIGVPTKKAILFCALFILVAITAFRYYRFTTVELETVKSFHDVFRRQVITRLDSLMYGIIGAYFMYYHKDFWRRYKNAALLLGLLLMLGLKAASIMGLNPLRGFFNCVFSFSVTSLGTLLLLPYLSDLKSGKGFVFKTLTHISLISYSMYLINFSLVLKQLLRHWELRSFIGNDTLGIVAEYSAFWLLTMALSTLIYKYFEIPVMNLRDARWVKRWFRTEEKDSYEPPKKGAVATK